MGSSTLRNLRLAGQNSQAHFRLFAHIGTPARNSIPSPSDSDEKSALATVYSIVYSIVYSWFRRVGAVV